MMKVISISLTSLQQKIHVYPIQFTTSAKLYCHLVQDMLKRSSIFQLMHLVYYLRYQSWITTRHSITSYADLPASLQVQSVELLNLFHHSHQLSVKLSSLFTQQFMHSVLLRNWSST